MNVLRQSVLIASSLKRKKEKKGEGSYQWFIHKKTKKKKDKSGYITIFSQSVTTEFSLTKDMKNTKFEEWGKQIKNTSLLIYYHYDHHSQ